MSDFAIEVQSVSRAFKRFARPRHRVMDLLGLKTSVATSNVFWALQDVTLNIPRGERVALIGRNGAGKSTLLNIVCGQLQPTTGVVRVNGRVQALMEVGTGFHPEFSGRQNVLSALAYQGISGRVAQNLLEEIVDFSELWDFIEYPVKTYSAGMYARLAFAAATAIVPDILIIDEVLGAGDAYFAIKSAERMYKLTVETGATVLFVSHDMSSVERLCNRAIWIDRGHVVMDGPALNVSKSYYDSVMAQEEARLQAETTRALERMRRAENSAGQHIARIVELSLTPKGSETQILRSDIGDVSLIDGSGQKYNIKTVARRTSEDHMERNCGTTGQLVPENARNTTIVLSLELPSEVGIADYTLSFDHSLAPGLIVSAAISTSDAAVELGMVTIGGTSERTAKFHIPSEASIAVLGASSQPLAGKVADSQWRSAQAAFVNIEPYSIITGKATYVFGPNDLIAFRIDVECFVAIPEFWLAIIIFDERGNRVTLSVAHIEDGVSAGLHTIVANSEKAILRQGQYSVTFEMLAEFDYYWQKIGRFPHFAFWDRCVFFKVHEHYSGVVDLGLVAFDMNFQVDGRSIGALKVNIDK